MKGKASEVKLRSLGHQATMLQGSNEQESFQLCKNSVVVT